MKLLVTGGAGFIGSAVVRLLNSRTDVELIVLDKLTYAGNLASLGDGANGIEFLQIDICDRDAVGQALRLHNPDAVMHLAAESHVDRSIDGPREFIETNVVGTFVLLEACRKYLDDSPSIANSFRFHHVSTDEVYGDLVGPEELFHEETPYQPSSPYSASKAAADHMVRAWLRTYGLPTIVTNCSNNYGPYQFPEKLIPHMILNALAGKELPVYGEGTQVRDWLYVDDHARALWLVLNEGQVGETYNIGGHNEKKNIDVVHLICDMLHDRSPKLERGHYRDQIRFVDDRPGHDVRYAIDASKIQRELGWTPEETFSTGLQKTLNWYLDNESWWRQVLDGSYKLARIGSL